MSRSISLFFHTFNINIMFSRLCPKSHRRGEQFNAECIMQNYLLVGDGTLDIPETAVPYMNINEKTLPEKRVFFTERPAF